ncbi:regulator of cell morphogenesis and NO signaling [Raineyella antarctica]|uniref:Regulator of cell morphogenesis and NO signaling n=1 Tax=Raineyella antarctica TaxID=1577474 RepID=A0A1G6HME5_9ACTN|nr:iron-sulfur cluster repair di-iron protein [Raineyella antarctica]SDB95401.1 regulator of cell morphogenesis and NO signaling [Raineyella antarctica]
MSIDTAALIGDLVTEDPRRTRVLESYGLDYCCGGQRSLSEAATAQGLDPDRVAADLQLEGATAPLHWESSDLSGLAHDIVDTHHAYLWEEMPRLEALVTKVVGVHGGRHPELAHVGDLYARAVADLDPHLTREERVVFPAITRLERTQAPVRLGDGSLGEAVQRLVEEHDVVGDLFAEINRTTGGYTTPEDGCASYAAMLAGLQQMEQDLHLHVHKENNVLFPKVVELDRAVSA